MRRFKLLGILAALGCIWFFPSCQKNAAPSEQVLNQRQKAALLEKVRLDTLYKEWRANQKKGFELMKAAVQNSKIDTARLKSFKSTGNEGDYANALKEAGMYNAEELLAINKRSMVILRELWKKYPALSKLTDSELMEFGKRKPTENLKP